MPNRILSGTVTVKGDIDYLTEKGVVFKNEPGVVVEVDSIIKATGYKITFPFISEKILPVKANKVRLYKHQFVPQLKHPSLAFIGLIQVLLRFS